MHSVTGTRILQLLLAMQIVAVVVVVRAEVSATNKLVATPHRAATDIVLLCVVMRDASQNLRITAMCTVCVSATAAETCENMKCKCWTVVVAASVARLHCAVPPTRQHRTVQIPNSDGCGCGADFANRVMSCLQRIAAASIGIRLAVRPIKCTPRVFVCALVCARSCHVSRRRALQSSAITMVQFGACNVNQFVNRQIVHSAYIAKKAHASTSECAYQFKAYATVGHSGITFPTHLKI